MRVTFHPLAEKDLTDGQEFYERQDAGVGAYFLRTMFEEIDSLRTFAGIHRVIGGKYRLLTRTFPYGIYYTMIGDRVEVTAVLDLRRSPAWIRRELGRR